MPTTKSGPKKIAFYPSEAAWRQLQKKMEQTGKTRTAIINDSLCLYGEIDSSDDLVSKIRAVIREEPATRLLVFLLQNRPMQRRQYATMKPL